MIRVTFLFLLIPFLGFGQECTGLVITTNPPKYINSPLLINDTVVLPPSRNAIHFNGVDFSLLHDVDPEFYQGYEVVNPKTEILSWYDEYVEWCNREMVVYAEKYIIKRDDNWTVSQTRYLIEEDYRRDTGQSVGDFWSQGQERPEHYIEVQPLKRPIETPSFEGFFEWLRKNQGQ